MEIEARMYPECTHERSYMHDILTKQIAVRGDPSRCDYIIAAREHCGNHDPASSVRSVCSSRATSSAHKRIRTHTQSDYPFRPFVSFAECCRRRRRRRCCCRCRPCLHSILIPIRVYGFACSRALLREHAHITTRLGAFGCAYTCVCICAYARTFNPRLVYVLRNARPVSTVPRDNDEGDEEVNGGNVH